MLKHIRHFCSSHILPMVYEDTLSYYEQICSLVKKINEVIAFINDALESKIGDLVIQLFDKMMIDAIYDEESETIFLTKGDTNE